MQFGRMPAGRLILVIAVAAVALVPVAIAASSPLLPSRDAVWVAGGLAGIVALSLLFVQPLFASAVLDVPGRLGWHRAVGTVAVLLAVGHVVGLYLYSPDDIMDALLFASPTRFSVYGVTGLGLLLVAAALGATVRIAKRRPLLVRGIHALVAFAAVAASAWHAMLVDGAMGALSKGVVAGAAVVAAGHALLRVHRPLLARLGRRRRG